MSKGQFITLEGTEGAGKSTAAVAIADWLMGRGVDLVISREPGGTALGEMLRSVLLDPNTGNLAAESELLMMFAARAQHIMQIIQPALEAGKWVLCDRFTDASFAYQGGGRGLSFERIEELEQWVHPHLQPDLTLLFDLPVEEGLQRAGRRNFPDRFEQEKVAFFTQVREAYLRRMEQFPGRVKLVDASQNVEQVFCQAQALIEPLF
ncbi:MAG: dTMP kinase [Gammaproteobacteria bacterium]|nr:MAG: dTMP kinase [Gammaproteobacteria bacterium]